jgi:threonine dehydrogenase-like Zn-dependent dehydrogenase
MHDHWGIIEEVRRLTGGRMCDVVIEAVGKEWPLNLAGDIVAEGGRLVIAGYHQDGPRTINVGGWNWRGLDIVNAHERDPAVNLQGLREAVEAAAAGRIDPAPFLTHCYPLERLGEALDATRDKSDGFVKAWIDLR